MNAYDVAIVGGGPAGATLARLLGKRCRVLLLERRDLGAAHLAGVPGKCCGGLLAPDAQKALAAFNLALPESVLGGPQIFAVRSIDLSARLERCYQRFYVNLNREAFDRWLAGMAEAQAECRWGAEFLGYRDHELTFRQSGKRTTVRCRYLVAADGAASAVRRSFLNQKGLRRQPDAYIAIQELVESVEDSAWFSAVFAPDLTDFYGWTIPKREGLLVGVALKPGLEAVRRFECFKRGLESYGMRLGKTVRREGAYLLRPRRRESFWCGEREVFAIGEAAGWISPSSAEGFSYAFESARILADLLAKERVVTAADYRRSCRNLHWSWLGKMMKMPFLYSAPLRRNIMRSGVTALEIG